MVSPGFEGSGRALSFPAPCANAKTPCPRVAISVPASADHDPGTADFSFGLKVRVRGNELTTDHGSNLIQKGQSTSSQWKLQVDDAAGGRPSCVLRSVRGSSDVIRVKAAVGVADGAWHRLMCRREGGRLAILVDGVQRGRSPVPGDFSVRPTGHPVTIGGNCTIRENDQYHGDLDGVTFESAR